ncbi:transcriptional regulator GlxA family with amidase domain [Microbacteriaceae bacterium SG_E_30_P1]|uniref:Transcriptional regulator GlxA family with amidase domain n=1 Tax=Antiquaquibacter oligotrophicus TaxID=2880260 RepID=A0ABT6KPE8_9MICO|nr:helix-turn-helix domain-containing protein [Antiquaquibacter oligotrophicus]MDH6181676.1 transcriptional regulator GlxA family with amidase domain [Antiquaquibacter oligotrophicus]UDF12640.1 helix-turn-helix domain-containing protein [Antiquaquibacter oligotrophicus]
MLKKVVLLAIPGVAPFEFGVVCEVFGVDRSDSGGPAFDFSIATAEPGPVSTSLGYDMHIVNDLSIAADADLVAVPAHVIERVDERFLDAIRDAERRGAWVLSVCSGAFTLAQAGILDGRRATTHWMHAGRLAREYPRTTVDPDVLFVEDGTVVTSAGTAAGIDAALHIVRKEYGAAATNVIARRMVVPPQREGGQSQYIDAPVSDVRSDSFALVAEWMLENLHEDLTVDQLARKALMSSRTFARRFRADMGTTPAAWLNRQRLLRAQQLLEQTDLPLEAIAGQTGFGSAAVMRHHFVRVLQTSPLAYRRAFGEARAS